MPGSLDHALRGELDSIERQGLLRVLRQLDSSQGTLIKTEDRELLNFSSNDYLGLASHPALAEAARREWETGGFGAGASRLICGTFAAHLRLEEAVADFKGTESALSFSSGYAAAMGAIPAICGASDVVILDKLSHACLVDAARLSGAVLRVFPHNDLSRLESHLSWARSKHPSARVLVVAESIYSMDGDKAPLSAIVDLKDRYGAWLFLDEAHAVGISGPSGRGLAVEEGVDGMVEIHMGTLGKALGAHGAYIAGSRVLTDFLLNRARSFVFSTAPPPPVASAATEAIRIVASAEGEALRASMRKNIARLASEISFPEPPGAIFPVMIGDELEAMSASADLLKEGVVVPAIRYPTVARGKARLRVTISAKNTMPEINHIAGLLLKILSKHPVARQ